MTHIQTIGKRLRAGRQMTVIAVPWYGEHPEGWSFYARFEDSNNDVWLIYRAIASCPRFPGSYVLVTDGCEYPANVCSLPYLFESPWVMNLEEAMAAGSFTIGSEGYICGIELRHGRWVYYTGTDSRKVQHGAADTQDEAVAMARIHLFVRFHQRLEEVKQARGGSLGWGVPIPALVEPRVLIEGDGNVG